MYKRQVLGLVCWLATVTTFLNDPFLQPICCATNAISAFYQMLRLLNHTKIFVYHRFRIFAAPTVSAHFYHFEEVGAGSPLLNTAPTRPGHLTPVFRHWERSVGMANEGVDWALSFADGAERADDGPDVNAQAPGPASTQRAGAKEKASQEPKTVRPRTRPVPACIHPRSRIFSPTTRPSP